MLNLYFLQVDAGNLHNASPLMLAAEGGFEAGTLGDWRSAKRRMGALCRARMWWIF